MTKNLIKTTLEMLLRGDVTQEVESEEEDLESI